MGIRFKCHLCQEPLNVKSDLARKRGVCPRCKGKFRVPEGSQEHSLSLDFVPTNSMNTVGDVSNKTAVPNSVSVKLASKAITKPIAMPAEASKSIASSNADVATANESTATALETTAPVVESEQLYFVRPPSGGEYGPAGKETIELWISQRRITAETLVCKLGSSQWKKAREAFASYFVLE